MGRPPRTLFPGAVYRVRLSGNNGARILKDEADRAFFLASLERAGRHFSLKLHAYCLMPSEAELILETPLGNLSRAMQAFETAFTKAFNSRHKRRGHVLQGRYRSELLSRAPLGADLCCGRHLGGEGASALAASLAASPSASAPSRPADLPAVDPLVIVKDISERAGLRPEDILAEDRNRRVSRARREAVYRAYQAGMTVSELSRVFRRTPGGIVQMVRKMEAA